MQMALMMRARPVLARARPQMTKRMLTQTSAEARRYSFAHAIDDIAGKAAFGGGALIRRSLEAFCAGGRGVRGTPGALGVFLC